MKGVVAVLLVAGVLTASLVAQGVLLQDDFLVPAATLNRAIWTTETGDPSFIRRTQLADWSTAGGIGRFVIDSSGAALALSTFNPTGRSLYGTHAKTRALFQPSATSTIEFTTRLQLTSVHPGIVYASYFYNCSAECLQRHDEIDIELLTNFLQPGQPFRVQLNRYANEPSGAGNPMTVNLPPGFDPLAAHDWTIRWSRQQIDYLLDGSVLWSTTTHVPQGPMAANIIAWAPDGEWVDAYSPVLQAAATTAQNQTFTAHVRSVTVRDLQSSVPPAPVDVTAVATASTLTVSWRTDTAPSAPPGHLLTFFSGGPSTISPATLVAQMSAGPQTQATFGVPPGTQGTFSVRVAALGAGGASLPSAPATFTIGPGGCLAPPVSPTGVTGTRAGRSVNVRWNASPSATSYAVEAGSFPGGTDLFAGNVGARTDVGGELDPRVPLFVRVVAVNGCGRSAPSGEVPLAA
jgi:hypothetical protein